MLIDQSPPESPGTSPEPYRIIKGDCLGILPGLRDDLVQTCISSPPYFGLRDYGVEGQIGLEPTPDEFVEAMVRVFREVKRVLRPDGLLWLNLGDSYAGSGKGAWNRADIQKETYVPGVTGAKIPERSGLPAKNLLGIPFRVALALQADGWIWRSCIPWVKRNPMPESTRDRPGSAVEYIFLFAKSDRSFYDGEAVKIGFADSRMGSPGGKAGREVNRAGRTDGFTKAPNDWKATSSGGRNRRNSDWFWDSWQGLLTDEAGDPLAFVVNPAPFKGAHFATFPPKLVEPMIRASTSEKGSCPACGAGWVRVLETNNPRLSEEYQALPHTPKMHNPIVGNNAYGGSTGLAKPGWREFGKPTSNTLGWKPGCSCEAGDPVPSLVLDPFAGAGTTGLVSLRLGRRFLGIELNPAYIEMIHTRLAGAQPELAA